MTQFTNRMAAVLMVLCLLVSLVIPITAAPSATAIITTPTGHTCATDVVYYSTNGILANWGARGEVCTFLSSYAESFYTTSGYTYLELSTLEGSPSDTAPDSALYARLQELMVNNHTFFTEYSGSGSADSRQLYKYTDCVSSDTSKLSLLYQGTLVSSTWDSGATYNQEHTWPSSKCIGTDATDIGDIMHLRPADPTENSTRGNKAYGESDGYYDPGVSVRGDCARTVLYMFTRWGNTENMWGSDGVIESQDILLKWIKEDPVDTWEMGRNDSVQSITGTRNVFVDYPELAFLLFDDAVPTNLVTPSGNASQDHVHSYSSVVTAPTCTEQGFTTYTCDLCSASYVSNYTDALGHSYSNGTCSVCGAVEEIRYTATLVTSASDLRVGDQIIIVASGKAYALSTTQNGNNRGQADITLSDDLSTVTFDSTAGVQLITLENGTTTGTFAFHVGDGYLYAASSSSNYLRTETTLSANSSWAISIADGVATVTAQGSNTRNRMRYNSSSKIFACYASGQQDIAIYVIDNGNANDCTHQYSTETVAATCTVDGSITYTCDLCGDTYTEVIAATGHSYTDGKCVNCGESEPVDSTWTKVELSEISSLDTIAITMTKDDTTWALYNGNGSGSAPTAVVVTVNGDTMTSETADTLSWNIVSDSNGLTIYVAGSEENYLYSNNSNNGVRVGSRNQYWSLDETLGYLQNKATDRYLGVYTGAPDWRNYTSTTTNLAGQTLSFWRLNATQCTHHYECVETQPTPDAAGYCTYTCTLCGHSYVDNIKELTYLTLNEGYWLDWFPEVEEFVYFAYTPTYTGKYIFGTYGNQDTYGEMYDENYNLLATAENGNDVFQMEVTLEANKTYIFGVLNHASIGGVNIQIDNAHNWEYTYVAPTCTQDGYETQTCTICGQSQTYTYPALGHSLESVDTPPTCTSDGYTTYTCTACGFTEVGNIVTTTGHTYESVVTAPTCTADGYTTYTCSGCGDSYESDIVPTTGHAYVRVVTAPTCTADGYTTYTCTACGDRYESDIVPTTGHTYESVVTAPTCTADGYTTYTCTACGDQYESDIVSTSGHAYEADVTAPTCQSDGYTIYTCSACGDSYMADLVPATGHAYESVVTAPTYNTDGYTTHTCTHCGDTYVDTIVGATGFTLSGANTALGSVLDMNFFIDPANLSGTDYYAQITLYAESGMQTTTIPYGEWEVRQDYLVVTLEGLAARQMADKIDVVIYNGDGTQASFLWTDSIRSYTMRILERQSDKCKTLIVNMLNYGAAAQTYFGYNTADLANNLLTDTQKAYATESVTSADQRVPGTGYYGSTLTLKDRIMLGLYFSNITPDMHAIVTFTDHKNNTHETRVEGSEFARYSSTVYGVIVDELVVADGDQLVTVTVYDESGNVIASASDTVNSYAARQMGIDPIFEMVAKFTTSAYTYFH